MLASIYVRLFDKSDQWPLGAQFEDDLPPIVCVELLRLLPDTSQYKRQRKQLESIVLKLLNPEWIKQDDLTSVFAVINAVHDIDTSLISGECLSTIVKRLMDCETEVGGPYQSAPGVISPVANAYISACMSWMAQPLPRVVQFLQRQPEYEAILDEDLPLHYLLQTKDPAVIQERHQQLLLAAITISLSADSAIPEDRRHASATQEHLKLADQIYAYCRNAIRTTVSEELAGRYLAALEGIRHADENHEISLLPYFYATVLHDTSGKPLDISECLSLGAANIYAWIAYTIYDDFLDGEGKKSLLSVAHIALRMMQDEYVRIASNNRTIQMFIRQSMLKLDQANTIETLQHQFAVSENVIQVTQLHSYEQRELLADRALMHVAGPMCIAILHGEHEQMPHQTHTLQALRHYLIARQLNDDIHDWIDDLQRGRITYVVAQILQDLGAQPGAYRFSELMPLAKRCFWQKTLPRIVRTALNHCQQTRSSFAKSGIRLLEGDALDTLIADVERPLRAARISAKQARELAKSYTLSPDK